MPKLDTTIHLEMLKAGRLKRKITSRIREAIEVLKGRNEVYGFEWGDPERTPPLRYVKDKFLLPYVTPKTNALEIGPGGGRWTRYLLPSKHIFAVDYHEEVLAELRSNLDVANVTYVNNNGDDFPGIEEGNIDFLFSFGTFVHLDVEIIDRYLANIKPLLNSSSNVVIQYSDKTKPIAIGNDEFSENSPEKMRGMVLAHGYTIYEEDLKTMWHSSIIRFGITKSEPS